MIPFSFTLCSKQRVGVRTPSVPYFFFWIFFSFFDLIKSKTQKKRMKQPKNVARRIWKYNNSLLVLVLYFLRSKCLILGYTKPPNSGEALKTIIPAYIVKSLISTIINHNGWGKNLFVLRKLKWVIAELTFINLLIRKSASSRWRLL